MPKTTPSQEVSVERQEVAVQVDTTPLTLPGLYEQLQASEAGLTTAEARKRLGRFGPNDPTAVRRTSALRQLLTFVANPLVVILFIASIVSATLGEVVNASIAEYTTADERCNNEKRRLTLRVACERSRISRRHWSFSRKCAVRTGVYFEEGRFSIHPHSAGGSCWPFH